MVTPRSFKEDGMSADTRCPKCNGYDWTGVQLGRGCGPMGPNLHPCHHDGVSEWKCNLCGTRIGRWSHRVLKEDEHEPPYGEKHRPGCPAYVPTERSTPAPPVRYN